MTFQTIWNFIRLTRPLFLAGGFLLYALGTLTAVYLGSPFQPVKYLLGQLMVTAIQLMTHYINEYYDIESDSINTARTWFSGGSGVLARQEIPARAALTCGVVLGSIAFIFIIINGMTTPLIGLLGIASLVLAWSYSGPPLSLASSGWGEISASVVVAVMVPLVGFAMQAGGELSPTLLITCLPLFLLHFAMLIAFQLPDWAADQAVNKMTLAVRLGRIQAGRVHNFSIFLAFCVILVMAAGRWPGAGLAVFTFPLAVWQIGSLKKYVTGKPQNYLSLTMRALGLFALTSGLFLVGLLFRLN